MQPAAGRCESPIRVPKTPSTFHPHARRNADSRRDARPQSRSFARWNPRLTEIAQVHRRLRLAPNPPKNEKVEQSSVSEETIRDYGLPISVPYHLEQGILLAVR